MHTNRRYSSRIGVATKPYTGLLEAMRLGNVAVRKENKLAIKTAFLNKSLLRGYNKYIFFVAFLAATMCHGQDLYSSAYESDSLYAVRNAVKVDPVQIVIGDYRLYYERILSDRWSGEASVGITRRNYAAGWFEYDLDNLGAQVDIRTGAAAGLILRRYFRAGPELDGPYLATGYVYREYIKGYHPLDRAGELTGESLTDRRRFSSIVVLFGIQPLSYSGNVFADFFTGPALRFADYHQVRAPEVPGTDSYYVRKFSKLEFGWEVGVRIGFGF